jgi:hypothetical protein
MRLVSISREIPWGELCRREPRHRADVLDALEELRTLPLRVMDRSTLPVSALGRWIAAAADQLGQAPHVGIDYAQLLCDGSSKDARLEAERVAGELTDLSRTSGIALTALASVGRAAYQNKSDDPGDYLATAKESGRWESDASVQLSIAMGPYNPGRPRERRGHIMVAKHRFGETGRVAVNYDGMAGRWTEVSEDEVPSRNGAVSDPDIKASILEAVSNNSLTTQSQVVRMAKGRKTRAVEVLKDMLRAGEVRTGPKGVFEVAL